MMAHQASFLQPRDPSILGWDQRLRFVDPVRKQLFHEILEEECVKAEKVGINTYLRLKPSSASADQGTFSVLNDTTVVTNPPKESATFKNKISGRVLHQYTFSKVFGPETTQKEIFEECVAYQVKDIILGRNCLVFAYGTTNAGKTFTIQGNSSFPGLIPRAIDSLFKTIRGQVSGVGRYKPDKVEGIIQLDSATIAQELDYKNRILNWDKPLEPIKAGSGRSSLNGSVNSEADFVSNTYREMQKTLLDDSPVDVRDEGDVVYSVWVSFAEVYNECIFDLLDPITVRNRRRIPLKMAQDGDGNTFIRDLRMIHVTSGDEAFHVMLYGKANLQVAATNMNMHSSRSHCIFTMRLVRYANSDNPSYAVVSSITFCDLAGAERAKKTLNAGERLKESNNINSSLHVLGRCLATIRENQKRNDRKPVPFRDSKLTRIFQRALTGHERITMVVNANTSPVLYDETVNVLKFAAIAKQIVLETPIKRVKPLTKKSRFSIMVTKPNPNGTICWDASPQDGNTSSSSTVVSSDGCIQQYNAKNEELLMLVEKLKAQVEEEREKNLTLERNIRQSVTETFSKLIADMENSWKQRLQDVEERNENLSSWRIAHLENYYKQQLEVSCKRRRDSDGDESIIECSVSQQDNRVKELEEEVELLESKCNAVHQLMKEAQDIASSLSAENSSLKFEVANIKTELEKCQRHLLASEKEGNGVKNALVEELQVQLSEEKNKVSEEMKKNENLRKLLDEAGRDFITLNSEKEESESELTKLHCEYVEKVDELVELNQQLEATQQFLTQKSREFEKLEEKYDTLRKAHEQEFTTILGILKEHEHTTEDELKNGLESLTVSDGEHDITAECQHLKKQFMSPNTVSKALKSRLQQFEEMKSCLESMKSQRQQVNAALEKAIQDKAGTESLHASEKSSMECEIRRLNDLLSETVNEKNCSISQIAQLQEEAKLLQKDVKDLLQKNIKAEQQLKDAQLELETGQNNSSRLEQELKLVLQKSNSLLNSSASSQISPAGKNVKAHEETIQVLKKWQEETNREKEQLKDELRKAQEEIRRREEQLVQKEAERDNIEIHRNVVVCRYEQALEKSQKDLETERRENIHLKDLLYKSTPTPKKNESAEIRSLKEQVESLQSELNTLKRSGRQQSAKKPPKSHHESVSSNESLKENASEVFPVPSSASKAKSSQSKLKSIKEPPKSDEDMETKSQSQPQRRARKLFSRNNSQPEDWEGAEPIEVENLRSTSPASFVKRSLRSRKV